MRSVLKNVRQFQRSFCLACALLLAHGWTAAGQDCGERAAPTPEALAKGLALGERLRDQLEASGASAALVGRIGLNLSEFGQRYTHMGLAVRDHVRKRWQVMHLFNPCGKSESEILVQSLEKFYEVDLYEYEGLIVTPSYAKQASLRTTFMSPATTRLLHNPAYNLISHPFNTRFQNSNPWILEMMGLAFDERRAINDRTSAQNWLKAQGFEPGSIRIPNLRRSGARLFSANVSFADHTQEEYEKQQYLVVTVDAIIRFLTVQDKGLTQLTVK